MSDAAFAIRTISGHTYPVAAESMEDALRKIANKPPDMFLAMATAEPRYVRQREIEQVFQIRLEDADTLVGVRSPAADLSLVGRTSKED